MIKGPIDVQTISTIIIVLSLRHLIKNGKFFTLMIYEILLYQTLLDFITVRQYSQTHLVLQMCGNLERHISVAITVACA